MTRKFWQVGLQLVCFTSLVVACGGSSVPPILSEDSFPVAEYSKFGKNVRVSAGPIRTRGNGGGSLVVSGNSVYTVWNSFVNVLTEYGWQIDRFYLVYSESHDYGETFSYPVAVTDPEPAGAFSPYIAVDSQGTPYILLFHTVRGIELYRVDRNESGAPVFTRVKRSLGNTPECDWRAIILFQFTISPSDEFMVLYMCDTPRGITPVFAVSEDKGLTFRHTVMYPQGLPEGTYMFDQGEFALHPDGSIYAIFPAIVGEYGQVFILKSTDRGRSFSLINDSVVQAPPYSPNLFYEHFRMAIDEQGTIHILWPDLVNSDLTKRRLIYQRSEDGGLTFSEPLSILDLPYMHALNNGVIAAGGGKVYVVWVDTRMMELPLERDIPTYVMGVSSSDGGRTFTAPLMLSDRMADEIAQDVARPSIAVTSDGMLHIFFSQARYVRKSEYPMPGFPEVFYAKGRF